MKSIHKIITFTFLASALALFAACSRTDEPKPASTEPKPAVVGATAVAPDPKIEAYLKTARFIVGVYNVEDLIQIPGTRWIVGSGVITGGPGMNDRFILKDYLHVFDAETETGGRVEPGDIAIKADKASYPETTTPPDWETFGPHGIGFGARKGNVITLYAINHGVREAVEVFKIDVSGQRPRFTWVGSVLAPEDGFIDAVAWIPGTDGFVVTALLDPRDPHGSAAKQMKGEPVGWVREWHPKSGWKTLPGTESFSTPNGIIVSEDGRHVFVAASTGARIYRVTRGATDPEVVSAGTSGLPDNIRWSADGKSILIANHTAPPEQFVAAQIAAYGTGGNVYTTWNVERLDPVSMKTEIVMPSGLYAAFGGATTAIEAGSRLWLGSFKSDRVAIFDLHPSTPTIK
ncbi:hypothetical protein [Petrachloros mirabilis]